VIRFVNLMEGHIWLESEGLGKGCTATFIVKLGIPERSNESKLPFTPKVPANHGQTNFPGLKVLVMDDNGSVTLPSFVLQSWIILIVAK
jgi:ethylene receptor